MAAGVTFRTGVERRARTVLLLDEPTVLLDAGNRATVVVQMNEAEARGAMLIGIVHDADERNAVCDRLFPMADVKVAA